MIYLTGDTHGDYRRFSQKRLAERGIILQETDYIIVCGDFGFCWVKDRAFENDCKYFSDNRHTILFVQGNHENYDMLEEYPFENWHGGKVRHIVRDKVILLERGQVFEIEGKTFFTFGGASSCDIQGGILDRTAIDFQAKYQKAVNSELPFRINHESWWEQELPTEAELKEGIKNLEARNYEVDYVITHCCATSIQKTFDKDFEFPFPADILTDYFQELEPKLNYKHWFFGHYHKDLDVDDRHSLLFHAIIPIDKPFSLSLVPVLGFPKYRHGELVKFKWNKTEKTGRITTVDAFGTSAQGDEPSYDIHSEEEHALFKHICETEIIERIAD